MPVNWKQILTTSDISALHSDAGDFGHLYSIPSSEDISQASGIYSFDGTEARGNVILDAGAVASGADIGKVHYKTNTEIWTQTSALNDTAGAKKLLGILVKSPNYFLMNGIFFMPYSSFFTGDASVTAGSQLYLSVFDGLLSTVPPADSGQAIRLVGYVLNKVPEWNGVSDGVSGDGALIFFSPSAVWLEQE
jgi:hypothetical protein